MKNLFLIVIFGVFASCKSEAEKLAEENDKKVEAIEKNLRIVNNHYDRVKKWTDKGFSFEYGDSAVRCLERETNKDIDSILDASSDTLN
jgi:hypothetical protein